MFPDARSRHALEENRHAPTVAVSSAGALHDASIQHALGFAARATRPDGLGGEPDERSRAALNVVCELARRDGLRVEQLIVLMKNAWRRLPEVRKSARLDADVTLTFVITHCIEEFYRQSRNS